MKAVVWHGIGDIRLDDVPEPRIEAPTDAIVRLTASAICGTDLHMVRGTLPGMREGTILGHEGVGVVEAIGEDVRNLSIGDRVVVPSTIACGYCSYCRSGYYSQCDNANPNGKQAGTAFYGGPKESGPFNGMQAEKVLVPFAHVNLVKLPDDISDDQAIVLSDIFPTGYFGAHIADIKAGDSVAVFGAGPVGQCVIASAQLLGAGRVLVVDRLQDRLEMARAQGAEVINFDHEAPVATIRRLTGGVGADRAIDVVGIDAQHAHQGRAAEASNSAQAQAFQEQPQALIEEPGQWAPGDAPAQALNWAVEALAKAGTLSIIGVYPLTAMEFPIGVAMNKNLTIRMGNCNHRRYIPHLIDLVRMGSIDPARILTKFETLPNAIEAFKAFDKRQAGWIKVELKPEEISS